MTSHLQKLPSGRPCARLWGPIQEDDSVQGFCGLVWGMTLATAGSGMEGLSFHLGRGGASHVGTVDVGPEVACLQGAVGAWVQDLRAGVSWPAWESGLVLGDGDSFCAGSGSIHTSMFTFTGVREISRKAVLWRDHYVVLVARQTTQGLGEPWAVVRGGAVP